jgi:type I site-specific restriction-modification system R (restriction) subunit
VNMAGNDDTLGMIQEYQDAAQMYESLQTEINHLLTASNGSTENMTAEEVERYRKLARQRDEAHNKMRWLEQQLLGEDTNPTGKRQ